MASWTIGREPDNDIVISDTSVSRHHAELRALGQGRYELTDTGSSNGTTLRNRGGWEPVGRAEVTAADVVRFGDHEVAVSRLVEAVDEDAGERTVRAQGFDDDPAAAANAAAGNGDDAGRHRAYDGQSPSMLQAGVGTLDRMVPALSAGTLRIAGFVAIGIAVLTLLLAILNFAAPASAGLTSILQLLLGVASIYVLLVLKKVLNQGYRFHAADRWIDFVVILAVVTVAASVLFAILAALGGLGAAAGPGTLGAGLGLFGILMLVLYFVQGVLLILLGVALRKVRDQAGGLFTAFTYMLIVAGGLMCTVILAGLGALVMLAAWVVLGVRMLQWADRPPDTAADVFD